METGQLQACKSQAGSVSDLILILSLPTDTCWGTQPTSILLEPQLPHVYIEMLKPKRSSHCRNQWLGDSYQIQILLKSYLFQGFELSCRNHLKNSSSLKERESYYKKVKVSKLNPKQTSLKTIHTHTHRAPKVTARTGYETSQACAEKWFTGLLRCFYFKTRSAHWIWWLQKQNKPYRSCCFSLQGSVSLARVCRSQESHTEDQVGSCEFPRCSISSLRLLARL